MNVTAGRVSADSTKVRRLPGQAPIKSCARPARSDPGVDGQIHKKTAANGVRVISGHAGAGAESIISVKLRCVTVPHARMLSDCTDMLAIASRFRTAARTPDWEPSPGVADGARARSGQGNRHG